MQVENQANILLVDDDAKNLLALEAILSDLGQNIVTATSGEEALKCLLTQEFAVILLDVNMPKLDGFETAKLIRERQRTQHTPIIFLTGIEKSEIKIFKGYTVGAVDYLLKPIVPEILTSKVSVFIELYKKTEEIKRQATQLAEANRELERQAVKLREQAQLLELTHDSVIVCNLHGVVQFWNRGACQMYGWTQEEMLGRNAHELLNTEFPKPLAAIQADLLHAGYWEGELVNFSRDRRRVVVSSRWSLQYDEAGRPWRCLLINNDISERKKAEVEIRQALEKEKELNKLKTSFISIATHEFRNPLTTIFTSAELLEHYGHTWLTDKKLKHLHRIQTAASHMGMLVDDVLSLSKVESGKLPFKPTPLDVSAFCRELVEEIETGVGREHRISFSERSTYSPLDANNSLPCLDEKLLRHILINLLSNATKYSPKGSPVTFELDYRECDVFFQITDRGIGIPEEDREHLFESFHRARNTGNIPGTGLGLSIVKKYVEVCGGHITFVSEIGVGTTFKVTIPRQPQTLEEGASNWVVSA
jgi:PAS domain S-box-containing protein